MRAYCDLIASATSKLSGAPQGARAALAETDEAQKLAPERPYSFVLRGRALEKLGRAPEALDAFSEAKKRDPRSLDDPQVLLSYARVLARTKHGVDAEAAYKTLLPRASWLDPRDRALAYVEAGLIVMKNGPAQIDDAVAIFRQARTESQDAVRTLSLVLLALALDRSGDVPQAQAVLGEHGDVRALFDDTHVKEVFDTVGASEEIDAAIAEAAAHDRPQESRDAWARYQKEVGPTGPWREHAAKKTQPSKASQSGLSAPGKPDKTR